MCQAFVGQDTGKIAENKQTECQPLRAYTLATHWTNRSKTRTCWGPASLCHVPGDPNTQGCPALLEGPAACPGVSRHIHISAAEQ